MSTAALYWHTLKYLRPVQVYGRLWFRLAKPKPDLRAAPTQRAGFAGWQKPAQRIASMTGPREFHLLGQVGVLDELAWDGDVGGKLWRYNQHYFDDLNALRSEERRTWHAHLLLDWVAGNPPGLGTGWEPYPTSLRIVNWVKWAFCGNVLPPACLLSLATQARWLAMRLEIHLLGNHLFANAKALVFAGLFFEGSEADSWLRRGLRVLRREVPEQILPDGGHFERSTMYHALALEDMLDLCNILGSSEHRLSLKERALLEDWRARVPKMLLWLNAMSHPDGAIAFFNDAAFDVAPANSELHEYAIRLGFASPATPNLGQSCWLRESGYARLQHGEAVVVVDAAAIGPDYLPGHAHADTLSFELSLGRQRVIVNSGTSQYGLGQERLRQRGTAAHSTVLVDGQDSSEVWSGFRVARRARILDSRIDIGPGVATAEAAHDGYCRLPGGPIHRRRWKLEAAALLVEDELSPTPLPGEARFHFHPDIAIEQVSDGSQGQLILPDGRHIDWQVISGEARVDRSSWHPTFGSSLPSFRLVIGLANGRSMLRLHWK